MILMLKDGSRNNVSKNKREFGFVTLGAGAK